MRNPNAPIGLLDVLGSDALILAGPPTKATAARIAVLDKASFAYFDRYYGVHLRPVPSDVYAIFAAGSQENIALLAGVASGL